MFGNGNTISCSNHIQFGYHNGAMQKQIPTYNVWKSGPHTRLYENNTYDGCFFRHGIFLGALLLYIHHLSVGYHSLVLEQCYDILWLCYVVLQQLYESHHLFGGVQEHARRHQVVPGGCHTKSSETMCIQMFAPGIGDRKYHSDCINSLNYHTEGRLNVSVNVLNFLCVKCVKKSWYLTAEFQHTRSAVICVSTKHKDKRHTFCERFFKETLYMRSVVGKPGLIKIFDF